jgi:hypothetical protein
VDYSPGFFTDGANMLAYNVIPSDTPRMAYERAEHGRDLGQPGALETRTGGWITAIR